MERFKKYLSKKEIIILMISLLIILLASFSYAFFLSVDNRDEDIVTTECFKTTFEDFNDINLDKAYPMSENEGSRLTPYTFTIKNLCNKAGEYQVNVETKEESSLSTNYLRYKLNSYSSDILGEQLEVQEYVNESISESRNIEAGVILPNEEITYNLRLWIDEASTVSQSSNKLYKGKIVIKTIENKEPYQTITLNPNGGTLTHNEIIKVKSRRLGNVEEPELIGYFLEDWFSDSSLTNRVDENTIVTSTLTNLYAKWVPRDDTQYKVEHYQMDLEGNYPDEPYEVETLQGTTNTNVTPDVKNYEGFSAPSTQTVNVNADGSQVVKYYYDRNTYRVTYNPGKGFDVVEYDEAYYGAEIDLPTPKRYGYNFDGWFDATTGGTRYTDIHVVTQSTTMYAQYTEKTYNLIVNKNGLTINGSTTNINTTLNYSDVYNLSATVDQWSRLDFNELSNCLSADGLTPIAVYNNKANGAVTVTSQSKSADNPLSATTSEYKIQNLGTSESQPGFGGFLQQKMSEPNKVYVHVFVAKLPDGYYLHDIRNRTGNESVSEWLTSNEGTGNWQTYAYKLTTGSTGTFADFGYLYVTDSPIYNSTTRTGAYTMYLAYSNIYDITNDDSGIGQIDGSATLTAKIAEKGYTLTINPNGGSWGGSTYTTTRIVGYSEVYNIPNPTYSGKTFNGWSQLSGAKYSDGLSSVKVYNNNANGVLTHTSQSKSSDNPLTGMSNQLKITNSGSAATQPGYGGFYHLENSAANQKYVHVFVAKLPVGYYFHFATNGTGTGTVRNWLTNTAGTGKWQTYVYRINAGSSGTFSNFGFVYVTKSTTDSSTALTGSLTWYLGYSNIINVTNNDTAIGQLDGTAVLTATWK